MKRLIDKINASRENSIAYESYTEINEYLRINELLENIGYNIKESFDAVKMGYDNISRVASVYLRDRLVFKNILYKE